MENHKENGGRQGPSRKKNQNLQKTIWDRRQTWAGWQEIEGKREKFRQKKWWIQEREWNICEKEIMVQSKRTRAYRRSRAKKREAEIALPKGNSQRGK